MLGCSAQWSYVKWECGVRAARMGSTPEARRTDAAAPVTPPDPNIGGTGRTERP